MSCASNSPDADQPAGGRHSGHPSKRVTNMSEPTDFHEHVIRVRYAECDSMGYLHHGKYFEYLEEARTEALRQRGFAYRDLEADGVFLVVAKLSCRYYHPIRYDDLVTVRTTIERFTRTRIDHAYQLFVNQTLTTEAATTLACVGRDGKLRVMPDRIWSLNQTAKPRIQPPGPNV